MNSYYYIVLISNDTNIINLELSGVWTFNKRQDTSDSFKNNLSSWQRENDQRNLIKEGLYDANENDIIMIKINEIVLDNKMLLE